MQTKLDTLCDTVSEAEFASDTAARKIYDLMQAMRNDPSYRRFLRKQACFAKLFDALEEAVEYSSGAFAENVN